MDSTETTTHNTNENNNEDSGETAGAAAFPSPTLEPSPPPAIPVTVPPRPVSNLDSPEAEAALLSACLFFRALHETPTYAFENGFPGIDKLQEALAFPLLHEDTLGAFHIRLLQTDQVVAVMKKSRTLGNRPMSQWVPDVYRVIRRWFVNRNKYLRLMRELMAQIAKQKAIWKEEERKERESKKKSDAASNTKKRKRKNVEATGDEEDDDEEGEEEKGKTRSSSRTNARAKRGNNEQDEDTDEDSIPLSYQDVHAYYKAEIEAWSYYIDLLRGGEEAEEEDSKCDGVPFRLPPGTDWKLSRTGPPPPMGEYNGRLRNTRGHYDYDDDRFAAAEASAAGEEVDRDDEEETDLFFFEGVGEEGEEEEHARLRKEALTARAALPTYESLSIESRIFILRALCEYASGEERAAGVAAAGVDPLLSRATPLGWDTSGRAYYWLKEVAPLRVYREVLDEDRAKGKRGRKNKKKHAKRDSRNKRSRRAREEDDDDDEEEDDEEESSSSESSSSEDDESDDDDDEKGAKKKTCASSSQQSSARTTSAPSVTMKGRIRKQVQIVHLGVEGFASRRAHQNKRDKKKKKKKDSKRNSTTTTTTTKHKGKKAKKPRSNYDPRPRNLIRDPWRLELMSKDVPTLVAFLGAIQHNKTEAEKYDPKIAGALVPALETLKEEEEARALARKKKEERLLRAALLEARKAGPTKRSSRLAEMQAKKRQEDAERMIRQERERNYAASGEASSSTAAATSSSDDWVATAADFESPTPPPGLYDGRQPYDMLVDEADDYDEEGADSRASKLGTMTMGGEEEDDEGETNGAFINASAGNDGFRSVVEESAM